MVVKIKLLTKTAKLPTQGSKSAAGFDVYSDEEIYINPGTCEKVHTGFSSEIPEGYFAGLYPRSGISTK
jgi:dUTPase